MACVPGGRLKSVCAAYVSAHRALFLYSNGVKHKERESVCACACGGGEVFGALCVQCNFFEGNKTCSQSGQIQRQIECDYD